MTREPGDLPLISVVARAGCLGADRFSIKHPVGASPRGASRVNSIGQPSETDAAASTDAATVYVCITCRHPGEPESEPRPGAILAAATAQAAECSGVVIRPVRCLANCTRGLSAAVRCNGSWTYVFGGLDGLAGRRSSTVRGSWRAQVTESCHGGGGRKRSSAASSPACHLSISRSSNE